MAVTQSDIDDLNAAIAVGERLVRKANGETIEYRSVADLIRARNDLARQLAEQGASGKPRRPRITRLYQSGRGF